MEASLPGVPAPGEIIANKYRVERTLGRGGMGVVLAAEHLALRQPVALKLLLPGSVRSRDAVERFLREARAAASLQSRHVVRVLDAGLLDAGAPYLVMERLSGHDLRAVLRARDHLPVAEAVDLLLQACEAIAEAHAHGIIHRDLKPANLFLSSDESGLELVKVLDFGLSKCVEDDEAGSLTSPGVIAGSIPYMAPEQALSLKCADARADIWALGVILYELITGRLPFETGSTPERLLLCVEEPPARVGGWGIDAPEGVERAIERCLQKDRRQRPQTVAELARALQPFGTPAAFESLERISRFQAPGGPGEPPVEPTVGIAPSGGSMRRRDERAAPETSLQYNATERIPWNGGAAPETSLPHSEAARIPSHEGAASETPRPHSTTKRIPWHEGATRAKPGRSTSLLIGAVTAAAVLAWALSRAPLSCAPSEIAPERLASFAPLLAEPVMPPDPTTAAQIRLGRMLFHEPRLSKNHDVACSSCHPLATWGVDRRKLSRGSEGREPPRNTLSVYNMAGYFALLWDGRKDNLVDQAKEVLLSPRAMAATPEGIEAALRSSEGYMQAFAEAFPDPPHTATFDKVARALAAFEKTLFTRSRWDRFLEGDRAALSDDEKAGFNVFVDTGCISCHFGPDIGATMYQKAGLVKPWPDTKDRGRYEITRRDVDWMVFRVPSLRNVAETGPYFHDGSVSSLEEAVRMMGRHQLGKEMDDREVRLIARWLGSLTGDIPRDDIELDAASRAIVMDRGAP
ncbi:cytochrome c peroxidase [Sorangium sp. So ce375]|uniref:cytochrome c peroxidase n=1 Tax=Sorangium sp. So ce375 TaxID=3133306 RepID=UPI003F5C9119